MTTKPPARNRFGGWKGLSAKSSGYFRVERIADRWWLIDPDGNGFISIGLNHLSSFALRAPEHIETFLAKYRNEEGWIRNGLVPDLQKWGFNTIGWTQEIAFRYAPHDPKKMADGIDPRRGWGERFALVHDRAWEHERYVWAGMPYCHTLNFLNAAYYFDAIPLASDFAPQFPDVFDPAFEDFCDWLARTQCSAMRDDPNLVGYFYSDIPDWNGDVHSNHWLSGFSGTPGEREDRLHRIASRYYEVCHAAIRRYDKNHLLLGDRYLGQRRVPGSVLAAMHKTVDVLSVQFSLDFDAERPVLERMCAVTGKPLLMADAVMPARYCTPPTEHARGLAYQRYIREALAHPSVVGVHFCGAYIRAEPRGWGVKSPDDKPFTDLTSAFEQIHSSIYEIGALSSQIPTKRSK